MFSQLLTRNLLAGTADSINTSGNTLRTSTFVGMPPPRDLTVGPNDANAGARGLLFDAHQLDGLPSVPTVNVNAAVGSAGASGLPGSDTSPTVIRQQEGAGVLGLMRISAIQQFQINHPLLDMAGRLGLPVLAGVLFYRGHKLGAAAAAAPAALLWYNRGGL